MVDGLGVRSDSISISNPFSGSNRGIHIRILSGAQPESRNVDGSLKHSTGSPFRYMRRYTKTFLEEVPMSMNTNRILQTMAGTAMAIALTAGAQAPAPAPEATPAAPAAQAPPAPAAALAAPTWSVGPMDISGMIDGYYSVNTNRPSNSANGQINDLYNFNDKTDQFNLSQAMLILNHDPDPVGAHIDLFWGRTNALVNPATTSGNPPASNAADTNYVKQAFLSLKPTKAKGFELDLGKFVTSAGAEVIESKDNWNYSRSLLSRGPFRTIILAYALRCRYRRPRPSASRWSTGGTTLTRQMAAQQ